MKDGAANKKKAESAWKDPEEMDPTRGLKGLLRK